MTAKQLAAHELMTDIRKSQKTVSSTFFHSQNQCTKMDKCLLVRAGFEKSKSRFDKMVLRVTDRASLFNNSEAL